jgi:hypothetical protein
LATGCYHDVAVRPGNGKRIVGHDIVDHLVPVKNLGGEARGFPIITTPTIRSLAIMKTASKALTNLGWRIAGRIRKVCFVPPLIRYLATRTQWEKPRAKP